MKNNGHLHSLFILLHEIKNQEGVIMKFQVFCHCFRKGLLLAAGALVVLGSVFSVPTNVVFAAPATPASYTALTKAYQNDQNWFKAQHVNVGRADNVVTQVQALISTAKSDGISTGGLEAAWMFSRHNFESSRLRTPLPMPFSPPIRVLTTAVT